MMTVPARSVVQPSAPETARPLAVAVVLPTARVPRWVLHVIDQLWQSTWATISVAVDEGIDGRHRRDEADNPVLRWWLEFDDRWFRSECQPDALSMTTLPANLDQLRLGPENRTEVDVVLDLTSNHGRRVLPFQPRLGVWFVRPGLASDVTRPLGYMQVVNGEPLTLSVLERADAAGGHPRILDIGRCPTDSRSFVRNANQACWQAADMIIDALRTASAGGAAPSMRAAEGPPHRLETVPSVGETTRAIVRAGARFVRDKIAATTLRERWGIAYRLHPGLDGPQCTTNGVAFAKPPKDRTWADPFVIKRGESHFVFIEELPYATNRGRIAVLEIAANGDWEYRGVAIEHGHHMSYPSLLSWNDELFMIPEEGESRSLRMYRCTRFPDRWEPYATLLDGVRAVDATICAYDGRWWMFASIPTPGSSRDAECHLYHAPAPIGPWIRHVASPIKRDPRGARPAGALFSRDGHLYRPAQDCATRYGGAVVIHRVVHLDEERFAEEAVDRIEPWRTGLVGTHTLNGCDGATVLDVLHADWRFARS